MQGYIFENVCVIFCEVIFLKIYLLNSARTYFGKYICHILRGHIFENISVIFRKDIFWKMCLLYLARTCFGFFLPFSVRTYLPISFVPFLTLLSSVHFLHKGRPSKLLSGFFPLGGGWYPQIPLSFFVQDNFPFPLRKY